VKLQLRREQRDAADTHKHEACDNLCNVRVERKHGISGEGQGRPRTLRQLLAPQQSNRELIYVNVLTTADVH
jgi:hypothetical protein